MNDAGMKQGQRFMALWHIEYVWLSAVRWKRLDVSDGHGERNLLNDSIPSEKLQEGFYLCLSDSGPGADVCGPKMNGKAVTQIYKASENKIKVMRSELRKAGTSLHVWHVCLMFETRAEEGLLFGSAGFCSASDLTLSPRI